jgi:hypothetical protein
MKKCFVKSAAIFFSLMILLSAVSAQENCELAGKSAPLLLNLQIGMSPEQSQSVFGKILKIKAKKKGERTFFQNFVKNPAPQSLNGVRALYLRFLDGKLYQLEIFYEPRRDLNSVESIAAALSAQLNFSPVLWQTKNKRAELKCREISLTADNVLNPRIELTNETIRLEIEKSRENAKKK